MRKLLLLASALALLAPASFGALVFVADLTGPAEDPPNASPGIGSTIVTLDLVAHTLNVEVPSFSGLMGTTTASHIHCCTTTPFAGKAAVATETPTFSLFPLGVTSGTFTESYDTTNGDTYNAPFLAAAGGDPLVAEANFTQGLLEGRAYLNIHSTSFPGGEIRGFLVLTPEPGTFGAAGLALAAVAFAIRKRIRL